MRSNAVLDYLLVIPNPASRSSQLFFRDGAEDISAVRFFSFVFSYLILSKQPALARLAAEFEIR
jgi:hypothetical protein